jgi:peptidoglycan hydrolase-like amidase
MHPLLCEDWQTLTIDNEQDPTLRESNLVMFDAPVSQVEFQGDIPAPSVHPIRVSDAPVHYEVADTGMTTTPRILSRSEWGADDSLLYTNAKLPAITGTDPVAADLPSTTGTPTQRETDCTNAQTNYPDEFKTVNTVKTENGKTLRWEHTYSKQVKLLVVHHTAVQVTGDTRSGAERVRALYQYHSINRGWGDIGYNYVVDEKGQIYEGKEGGPYIVAGHAFCNNVGTIGVALLGNFEVEQPTQAQMQSLQWLLGTLAKSYNIDLTKNTTFHGKTHPPIIGHRDLLDTDCPGYYVYGLLDQIRANVRSGNVGALLNLLPLRSPLPVVNPSDTSTASQVSSDPPEDQSEDSAGQSATVDRLARLQRKIRTAVRLSSRVGGRASQLATARKTNPVQQTKGFTHLLPKPVVSLSSARSRSSIATLAPSSLASASPTFSTSSTLIKVHLSTRDTGLTSCDNAQLQTLSVLYRGTVSCTYANGTPIIIDTVSLEEYMMGLGEEPDTEPYEKQRAFAIAARTYAAYYLLPANRKFPGAPYDASDSPATFQKYVGRAFEGANPNWEKAVTSTASEVLMKGNQLIKPPYFSSDDGVTRSPVQVGWGTSFPFADIFSAKSDPWCKGMTLSGHGVGMSGCGAKGQALAGQTAEQILQYYYPTTVIQSLQ